MTAVESELDEAEEALREGVAGCLALYGREHPGYALGLEPLAELLLRRGDLDEAGELCNEAFRNFIANGHERMGTALALRSEIVKTGDASLSSVLTVRGPDAVFDALMEAMLAREPADPHVFAAALEDTLAQVRERYGDQHELEPRFLSRIVNLASVADADEEIDHERRCHALADLVDFFDRSGDGRQAVLARLALGLAQCDAGDHDEALEVYEDARLGAEDLGDPDLVAMVLRVLGNTETCLAGKG